MGWRWRRRRAAVAAPPSGDPYAEYLAWKAQGRPPLEPADLFSGDAIALSAAADDVPEDPVRPARALPARRASAG